MQKSFSSAFQYAHYLIQLAKQKPSKLQKLSKSDQKWKSLPQKLTELYVSSTSSSPNHECIFSGCNLLQKLVEKEKLNCLVVNLYPVEEGYSITVKSRTGNDTETSLLSYEDDELLQYIDNQELPPLLVDLLERSQVNLFYNGCIIVEIRDFRNSAHSAPFKTRYSLLKPTNQSIVCDVSMLTNDNQKWTWEERHALESALVLATSDPLCLDPSVSVSVVANYFQHSFLSRDSVKKVARNQSAVMMTRKRKFREYGEACASKWKELFAKKQRTSSKVSVDPNIKPMEIVSENYTPTASDLALVQKCAKALPRPRTPVDYSDVLVEEYSMEVEKSPGKIQCTKITICHCPATDQYSGTLCFTRDGHSENAHCNFHLGSRSRVDKYITQFTGIFTEEGRKPVKITHHVPGQPPKVTYTPGAREHVENIVSTAAASAPTSRSIVTTASLLVSQVTSAVSSAKMVDTVQEVEVQTTVPGGSSSLIEMTPSPTGQPEALGKSPSPMSVSVPVSANSSMQDEASITICDVAMKDSVSFIHGDRTSSPPASATGVSLSTLNLAQNLGLHNLVSIPGMNVPQTLTVPITLSMMSSGQPTFLTTSTGLAIGSLCGVGSSPSPPPLGESPIHSASSHQISSRIASGIDSQPFSESSIVTVPVSSVVSLASPPMIITTGLMTSASSVLTSASPSLLSLPLNVAGTNVAAQLVASNVKGPSATLRPTTVSLLQVNPNGQSSSVPLIGAVQHSLLQSPKSSVSPVPNQSAPVSSSSGSLIDSGSSPTMASPGLSVATPLIALLPQNQGKQQVRQAPIAGQPKPKKKKQQFQYSNK